MTDSEIMKAQKVFGYHLLLANKLQNFGDTVIKEFTLKQWFLLLMITKMDEAKPSLKQIADFTGTSRQNVKKMLVTLEKKGYITSSVSDEDARAIKITVTQKSHDYMVANEIYAKELIENIFKGISEEEMDTVLKTGDKLFANLQEGQKNE